MKGLLGIHITPPDRAVVPPTRGVFSSMRTLLLQDLMTRPAHIDPPPLPTTTKSTISSKPLMCCPVRPRHYVPNPRQSMLPRSEDFLSEECEVTPLALSAANPR